MDELIIFHQNLHKSIVPTQELLMNADFNTGFVDQCNKILCVQEPFTRGNRVVGFGLEVTIYATDDHTLRTRAAIITKCKDVLQLAQHCSPDCVLISVNFYSLNIYVCNVYCDPLCDFDLFLLKLDEVCVQLKGRAMLITGDINAKHSAWNSPVSDGRGKRFFDFCCAHNLHILNNSDIPTYTRSNSTSFIDVSVCSLQLLPFIKEWSVSDKPTFSDHKLIVIKIANTTISAGVNDLMYLTRVYKTKKY